MATIKLTALTPIHIGNGNNYTRPEYLKEGNRLLLIDDQKLYEQIPEKDRNKEMMGWANDVQAMRQIDTLLTRLGINTVEVKNAIAKRSIPIAPNTTNTNLEITNNGNIRQQIYTGSGKPYIPGSSLKGAIASALLGAVAENIAFNDTVSRDRNNQMLTDRRGQYKHDDKLIQKTYFGNINDRNNNNPIFRFLQVGDAEFKEGDTEIRQVNGSTLHRDPNNYRWDSITSMEHNLNNLIECITRKSEAIFRINDISQTLTPKHEIIRTSMRNTVRADRLDNLNLNTLFEKINQGTLGTIENLSAKLSKFSPDDSQILTVFSKTITTYIKDQNNTTCILRLGWGSGYDFITGGWQRKMSDRDRNNLYDSLKRGGAMNPFPYPKTVRTTGGMPLGFVKLEII
ncbi:MAG: type III-A CRISPR-associated RAMP protein Csm5 [Phycisphaerales bacterium]|nr:type III-A CRISPR-associated RAMP protein Csm5 [Phycisphaerales bacterium]